jgi:uncharacterized protein with GYD domain
VVTSVPAADNRELGAGLCSGNRGKGLNSCGSGALSSDNFITTIMGKDSRMPVYVMLGNLTHAAFDELGSIDERDRKAKAIIESLGGKMISLYYTLGQYDFVVVFDMPSKEMLVKFLTIMGKFGNVRTETMETIPSELLYKIAKEV